MHDICPLDRCEYANSWSGNCIWPGDWCPHVAKRNAAVRDKLMKQQAMKASRKRKEADSIAEQARLKTK